jgi:hypothetical protein
MKSFSYVFRLAVVLLLTNLIFIGCKKDHSPLASEIDQSSKQNTITIEHVRKLEAPVSMQGASGNSHLLPGMPKDGPCFAVSWATSYENCTVGFYNADLELVDTWREPWKGGEKVMTLTAGDLDDDGENEILLTVRKEGAAAYALRWNKTTQKLETRWAFKGTNKGPFYRGIEVGNFTNHPGKEVCFGGDGSGLYLLDNNGQLIRWSSQPSSTIQRIDVCDNDGDGYDEMIVSTGRNPGEVHYMKWDPESYEPQIMWSAKVTQDGLGGDNCYEALYHQNGHPDGGPAIAVNTEQEAPTEARSGSVLLLDMDGNELWRYIYTAEEERGGACGFADVTGEGVPEIFSRYSRILTEPHELGVVIFDNKGNLLAKIPNVSAGSAGPYVFCPNGPPTSPLYLIATTNVYEIKVQ